MSKRVSDVIAMRHPSMPGEFVLVHRRTFPSHEKRGWVEAKSPEAKAAVEANTSLEGTTPTPSKEDPK